MVFQRGLNALAAISPLLKHVDLDDESYGKGWQKPLPSC